MGFSLKKSDPSIQIATYALAWLSHQLQLQKQLLDFDKIWKKQALSAAVSHGENGRTDSAGGNGFFGSSAFLAQKK